MLHLKIRLKQQAAVQTQGAGITGSAGESRPLQLAPSLPSSSQVQVPSLLG